MIVIDLNAPTVHEQTNVWRIFPGAGYRFLEEFRQNSVGFLDLPGLSLPEGDIEVSDELLPRILASVALNAEIAQRIDNKPNLSDWNRYTKSRKTKHRGRLRQSVINILKVAEAGDLVVLPEALNVGYINVGVIVDNEIVEAPFIRKGWEWTTLGRRINWIKRVRENTVSSALSNSLRNQHPFSLLQNSLKLEAFSIAYNSYVYQDKRVASIFNHRDDYLDADSALLGTISKLAAAACKAIDEGKGGIGDDTLSVILDTISTEYACNQESDIHSAGFNRFISSAYTSLVIAAVMTALLTLSACSTKEEMEVKKAEIQVVNLKDSVDHPCAPPVSEATMRILKSLNIDETWKLCRAAEQAKDRAGLASTARVLHIPIPQPRPR